MHTLRKKQAQQNLYSALLLLETVEEAEQFMKDICTPHERELLAERWAVCQLLATGEFSYREIHEKTGASLTTITRVARFLRDEHNSGYTRMLQKTAQKLSTEKENLP